MTTEALVFIQPALDAAYAARLEITAFIVAMLMYSVLLSKRVPVKPKARKKVDSPEEPRIVASGRPEKKHATAGKVATADNSARPDVAKHIVMIRKCGMEKDLKGAFSIFETLKETGVEMNSVIYNTVLHACVKCGDLKAAHDWMAQTKQDGFIDVVSFNTLMKAYLLNNRLDKARGIVREMKEAGFQPNRVTFNELINAIVSGGGTKKDIWDVVKEMKEMGMPPNQVTCSILLKDLNARSAQDDIENVMDLITSIEEPMDEVLMSSVVEACVRIGKPDLLTSKLKQLQDTRKLVVNSSHTFGSLIKAYGHAHDITAVWRCWKEMRSRLIKPTSITLGCMIEALVNNGCTEDAYDLIRDLQADSQCKDSVNAVIFCSILKGFAREKRLQRVWAVYEEMEQKDLEMSLVTFNTVMDACARVGRMEDAPKILEHMKKHRVEPNIITFSTIIKGHCQAGRIELAFETLNKMKKETSLKPDEIMFNSLLDGCAQNGLYSEGMDVFDMMVKAGVRPSHFTLSILVKLMNRSRKVDEAFSIVQNVSQKYGIKPNAHVYTNLIQACVSNRRHSRALSVVETMLKEGVALDSRTYGVLIRASIFQNQYPQAVGFLRGALGLPGALDMLVDSKYAICSQFDNNLVNETLAKLADCGCMDSLVAPLIADLKKSKIRVQIDPALHRRATESVAKSKN
jgi:pentatricopeptide repeat protein